jgi:hypothetical protein
MQQGWKNRHGYLPPRIGRTFLTQFRFGTISMQLFCLSELPMASVYKSFSWELCDNPMECSSEQQFCIQWRKVGNFSSIAGNSKLFTCLQIWWSQVQSLRIFWLKKDKQVRTTSIYNCVRWVIQEYMCVCTYAMMCKVWLLHFVYKHSTS